MSFTVKVVPGSFKESQILREASKLKLEVIQEKVKLEYHEAGSGYKAIVDVLLMAKKDHIKLLNKETFDRHFESTVNTKITNVSDMSGLFPGGGDEIYERIIKSLIGPQ